MLISFGTAGLRVRQVRTHRFALDDKMILKAVDVNGTAIARVVAGLMLVAGGAAAQEAPSVLEDQPVRLRAFETANVYHAGSVELTIGTHQSGSGPGTGLQTYYGSGSYAVSDQLSFGLDFQNFNDPVAGPIGGSTPLIDTAILAFSSKYQFFNNDRVSFAAQASLESFIKLNSPLFGGSNSNVVIGSIKAPLSFNVGQGLQLHLTPAVSVFPSSVSGTNFYGTVASIGAGASYKPSERFALYGSIDAPVSGSNTIDSAGNYTKEPVWTVGARYNVTPKAALEAYLTNGFGMTPATSILTFWPEGDEVLAGMRLIYTPGAKRPVTYRASAAPATVRQAQLQQDGFTLGSADVLDPGHMRVSGWYGSDNNGGALIGFSPDQDGEIQVIFEQYSDNPTAPANLVPTTAVRYMIGPKFRFMDQNNGNAFSLAARVLYGRQIESNTQKLGVFFAEAMASYKTPGGRFVLTANPKVAAFGNTEIGGLGLGVNFKASDALELIGEVTPVALDGNTATWAAGLRYNFGNSGFSVDARATNAIGHYGVGTMVAQDDVLYSLTLSKAFDLRGLKFY